MGSRLYGLDALRGLAAALLAFVYHLYFVLGVRHSGPLDGMPGFTLLHQYGSVLVDLFFVISGFIFSHVYLSAGKANTSGWRFATARFARLYPLHLATLLLVAGLGLLGRPADYYGHDDAWHFALHLLMLQESGLDQGLSFNIPAWSIAVEVYCYALFFVLAARYPKLLLPASAALLVIGLAATFDEDAVLVGRGLCGFFTGVIAFRFRSVSAGLALALIAAGICLAPLVPRPSLGAMLSLTAWVGLVLLGARVGEIRFRPLLWLGDRSYSIYLLHAPVYYAINILAFHGEPVPVAWWPAIGVIAPVCVLLVAEASYVWFETPLRRRLKRLPPPRALPALPNRFRKLLNPG
ncbi:MAG TPA: acyltransferase [Croceibacterium sp.]